MKKILFPVVLLIVPAALLAQIGLKVGLNFANVTNASSINNSSQTGFNAGLFLAPNSKGLISSRTEVLYSRQGYNYKTNTNTGNVNLDYIMIPQFMGINITRFVQIQLGAQMAFLLNAKADSSKNTSGTGTGMEPYAKAMDYYNRFDYGFGGGVEIHPVSGLLVGARINFSLGDLYKNIGDPSTGGSGAPPSFVPKVNVKNNVFQVFTGWTFGNKNNKSKKSKSKSNSQQQ